MGNKDQLPDLFKKLVDNNATEKEVRMFLEMIRKEYASDDLDAEMEQLWAKVGEESIIREEAAHSIIFKRLKANVPLVTVVCAGILVIALWFLLPQYQSAPDLNYAVAKAAQTKTTVVQLADGSRVTLNSGSVLRYPETFGDSKREVYLEGEAYFEVKHDPEKSFLVHTGKVTTTVLGTSFNVSAYNRMPTVAVTVVTGKVGVKNEVKKKSVSLLPSQRAVFNAATRMLDVDSVDNVSDAIAWRTGKLVFSAARLDEVCLKLGHHFGVEVSINNRQKREMKINGSFSDQSLETIVEAICELSQTKYRQSSAGYVIY